ncbi:hypothetical protein ABPG72_000386 [Tetrahymena utriculariae]
MKQKQKNKIVIYCQLIYLFIHSYTNYQDQNNLIQSRQKSKEASKDKYATITTSTYEKKIQLRQKFKRRTRDIKFKTQRKLQIKQIRNIKCIYTCLNDQENQICGQNQIKTDISYTKRQFFPLKTARFLFIFMQVISISTRFQFVIYYILVKNRQYINKFKKEINQNQQVNRFLA